MHCFSNRFFLMMVLIGMAFSCPIKAATTAQYLFDTEQWILRTTAEGTASTLVWQDSSGNGNDLYRRHVALKGQVWLVPELVPTANQGQSLRIVNAGPIITDTPNNASFSLGSTGQRTVEFWYQPRFLQDGSSLTVLRYIMSQDDYNLRGGGGNGWSLFQNYDDSTDRFGFGVFLADTDYQNFIQLNTPNAMQLNQWYHLAMTMDTNGPGGLKLYIDGVEVAAQVGLSSSGNFGSKTNAPLLLAFDSNVENGLGGGAEGVGGFSGSFGIDDLRFSDVALLPGSGSGINELAWNVSLSPSHARAEQ